MKFRIPLLVFLASVLLAAIKLIPALAMSLCGGTEFDPYRNPFTVGILYGMLLSLMVVLAGIVVVRLR